MEFKSFEEVTLWLDSFSYKEKSSAPGYLREARLERMSLLLDHIGNPERDYSTIHVAGSKGKGSTALYTAVLLKTAGYKTGLYLSPHLFDYRERFTLAGDFFSDDFLIAVAERLAAMISDFSLSPALGPTLPSTFEMYTAYAYLLFSMAGCTHAVIETGIGGRLDATNTIDSYAEILTPIELEHTEILGHTIRAIAIEKSKIIKHGSTVFSALQKSEADEVFKAEAAALDARYMPLEGYIRSIETRTVAAGEECTITYTDGSSYHLMLSMRGEVQAENAALAILVSRVLGFFRPEASIAALESAKLPGRFENYHRNGAELIIDVAHTASSMAHTVSSFTALFPDRAKRICIFGAVEGKDTEGMLKIILAEFDKVIISRPGTFKKSDPEAIYRLALSLKKQSQEILLVEKAEKAISMSAVRDASILIAGSFYLAADAAEALNGN